jgi:hypothetical protein
MVYRAATRHTAARGLTGLEVFQKIQYGRLLICAAMLVAGCGAGTETELSRSPSPDERVVVHVVQVDPGGGATVAFINYVYLSEAGRDRSKTANFEGYSCGPLSVAWKDNQRLEIAYPAGCRIRRFDNQWWTSSGASARMVELILRRVEAQPN